MVKTLFLFLLGLVEIVVIAFVLKHTYVWFVIPLGAPTLSLSHVAGLLLMVKLATMKLPEELKERPIRESVVRSMVCVLTAGFFWLAAWIFYLMM